MREFEPPPFAIDAAEQGGRTLLTLSGELDLATVGELETAQINDDVLACIQARGQRGLELPDRGQVKLTGQVEQRALFLLRDVDGERRRLGLSHP